MSERSFGRPARCLRTLVLMGIALLVAGAHPGCDRTEPPPVLFNFHAIEAGQAYRSSQLSGQALSWVIDNHGIKTVVNLRGPNPGKPWYDEESATCQAKNVALVDLPMSSRSLPDPELLRSIIDTLRTAQYPILIHCESGSDRSGAVSALYRIDILQHERSEALRELGTEFWHFRSQKPCMDALAEMYEPTEEWMAQYERDYEQLTCE